MTESFERKVPVHVYHVSLFCKDCQQEMTYDNWSVYQCPSCGHKELESDVGQYPRLVFKDAYTGEEMP